MDKEAVLAFFGGALLGAIGAAVWTAKRYKKELDKFIDEYDEYIDYLENQWKDHCANCQNSLDETEEIYDDDDTEFEELDADDYERDTLVEHLNTLASLRDENGVVNYDKLSTKNNKTEEADTEEADESNEVNEPEDRVQDQYLDEEDEEEYKIHYISQDEFDEPFEEFEKIELTYLEGSDIFLTEENEKYNAYPAIGGRETLETAFEENGNGVVHIRNDALEMDFRIVSDIRDYDTYIEETSDK